MGAPVTCFDFKNFSANDILDKIKSLKTGKSHVYDGIQAKFLKSAGANLTSSLSMLFDKWLISLRSIRKLGNLCKNNYRSVNLLYVLYKLFESITAFCYQHITKVIAVSKLSLHSQNYGEMPLMKVDI